MYLCVYVCMQGGDTRGGYQGGDTIGGLPAAGRDHRWQWALRYMEIIGDIFGDGIRDGLARLPATKAAREIWQPTTC